MNTPFKIRDAIATPFMIISIWLMLIASIIGSQYTAEQIIKFVNYKK